MPSAMVHRNPWHPRRTTGYDIDIDPARMPLASGALVSSVAGVGTRGITLTAAGAARPTYVTDVANGHPVLRFAGAQYLRSAAFSPAITQPTTYFAVCSASGISQFLFDGLAVGSQRNLVNVNASGNWQFHAGTNIAGPARTNGLHVITAVFNGVNSFIRVDGVQVSGNPGSQPLGGLTLGANAALSLFLTGDIARFYSMRGVRSTTEIARNERYLSERYAITGPAWEVTTPKTYFVYQRTGVSTDLTVAGRWNVLSGTAPTGIEVNFRGAGWVNIGATINSDGTWSGTLPAQAKGQGTMELRRTDTPADVLSVPYVGVQSAVAIFGESIPQGHADEMQPWTHATLRPSMFRENSTTPELLADPTDSDVSWGSYWPRVATSLMADQAAPVMFVTAAKGGTGLVNPSDWGRGDSQNNKAITTVRASGVTGLEFLLMWLGANDMNNNVATATWVAELLNTHASFKVDLAPYLPANRTVVMSDAFNGVDGASLAGRMPDVGGSAWVLRNGIVGIGDNRAVAIDPVPADLGPIVTNDTGVADGYFEVPTNIGDDGAPGVVLRLNPADGTHFVVRAGPNTQLRIDYYNGTEYVTRSTLGSAGVRPNTDHPLTVSMFRNIIFARNGTAAVAITNAVENMTSTHHGVRFGAVAAPAGSFASFAASSLSLPMFLGTTGYKTSNSPTREAVDQIRMAQIEAADTAADILIGPPTYDIGPLADGVHPNTNAQYTTIAARLWRLMKFYFYGGTEGQAPRLASITQVDDTHTDFGFTLEGTTSLVLGASPTIGWRAEHDGGVASASAVALQSATDARVTWSTPLIGTPRYSFASFNDGTGATIVDNGATPLPLMPFVDEEVS